jgi:hypothetical protein
MNNLSEITEIVEKYITDNKLNIHKDKIINFLNINNLNIISINKNHHYNLQYNDDFYCYVNNNELNKFICFIIGKLYGTYNFNYILNFNYDNDILTNINNTLLKDGVYINEQLINNDICNNIIKKINYKNFQSFDGKIIYNMDINEIEPGTNWIHDQKDVILIEDVQKIATDPFILNVAQNYLQSKPILIQSNLWISKAGSNDRTNFFHQDYDDIKFLKVFIYLTDTDENNGAHSYVKGSINNFITDNNYKPSDRISDDIMKNNYGENVITICGKKGTVIFEDTNGFHKGNILNSGYRIMLQLQYCCSTKFVDNKINFINNLDKDNNKILYDAKLSFPDSFILYNFN